MKKPRKRTSSTERKIGRKRVRLSIVKDRAWKYWSKSLHLNERKAKIFKIATQMRKERKDIVGSRYIRDENGSLKVKEEKVVERWRSYFSSLLNEYKLKLEEDKVERPIWGVTEQIVEQALKSMKVGKAPGQSGVISELIKTAGSTGVKGLFQVCESLNRKARFHSTGPRVIPYWYIYGGQTLRSETSGTRYEGV